MQKPISDQNEDLRKLLSASHEDPFSLLGVHRDDRGEGYVIRVFRPDARSVDVSLYDRESKQFGDFVEMQCLHKEGFFSLNCEGREGEPPPGYRLRYHFKGGSVWESHDPFSFGPILSDDDIYYLKEGSDRQSWHKLGAQLGSHHGVHGVRFVVWAPNARRVSVVGDFNNWDGRIHPMRLRIEGGFWEIFIPGVERDVHYKFEMIQSTGRLVLKSDPYALYGQHGGPTASITWPLNEYQWQDDKWMQQRTKWNPYRSPLSIYEVHPGSWARVPEDGDRPLTYREMADRLLDHVETMGFTHIEFMPITEFPFDGSWGYQVTGFFAPTSRFGNPDDFRYLVDKAHQRGIGVIVDWVPAHFPKDEHGLAYFDGTPLYEHADPRQGEHQDWGTNIFNFGRTEVRNFLVASALFWLKEYHIDGLRVDAVASMIYLDYSRAHDQWVPNVHGGRENLEAIDFLRMLNEICYDECPGAMVIAEESTAWGGVSRPTDTGGLGFGFKWNMGWMNDTLHYIQRDPLHRSHHHGEATFSMLYAYDENFILVLSHDEVVHGKGSLLNKMPGDRWQKFANLRMLYGWMFAHPGKKLLFQGSEIGQWDEWDYRKSVDWHLLEGEDHEGIRLLVKELNRLYSSEPALHAMDHEAAGYCWLDHSDAANSIFTFMRCAPNTKPVYVAVNATPVPRHGYRMGVATPGKYREIFNSDHPRYSGSGIVNSSSLVSEDTHWQGQDHSILLTLPPLAVVFLQAE